MSESIAAGETAALQRARKDFERRCEVLRERLKSPDFLANKGLGNEVGFYLFCYDPALELEARDFTARLIRDARTGALPCVLREANLCDMFLGICEKSKILVRIPSMEERRGLEKLRVLLSRSASTEAFVEAMAELRACWESGGAESDHAPDPASDRAPGPEAERAPSPASGHTSSLASDPVSGPAADNPAAAPATPTARGVDAVIITGVGEIYPVLRLHGLFEALQQSGVFADVPVVAAYPGRYTGQALSLFGRLEDGNYYRAFDLI